MKIDRHNYEEYFILYLDNELSDDKRREVEAFAKAHPDLKEELDILLQSKLVPDQHIVFEGREELLSFNNLNISLSNYEEWLVLYTDNELSAEQRRSVEQFAAANPSVQDELNLLLKTRLTPETAIVFPNKESLYRREEKTRPIVWWRIAAAAAVLIAIGSTSVLVMNRTHENNGTSDAIASNPSNIRPVETMIPGQDTKTAAIEPTTEPATTQDSQQKNLVTESFATSAIPNSSTNNRTIPKQDNPETDQPVAETKTKSYSSTIDITSEATPLTNTNNITPPSTVTNSPKPRLDDRTTSSIDNGPEEPVNNGGGLAQSDEKKSKFRGFFRKVTRTFEKTTNIDATDGEDRLLVGALAIKLK
jgi:hypothetical protein